MCRDILSQLRDCTTRSQALAACRLVWMDTNPALLVCTVCQHAVTKAQILTHTLKHFFASRPALTRALGPHIIDLPLFDDLRLEALVERPGFYRRCAGLKSAVGFVCSVFDCSYATPLLETLRRHHRLQHAHISFQCASDKPSVPLQQVAPGQTATWFAVCDSNTTGAPFHNDLAVGGDLDVGPLHQHLKRLGATQCTRPYSVASDPRLRSSFIIRSRIGDYVDVCGLEAVDAVIGPIQEHLPEAALTGLAVEYLHKVNAIPQQLSAVLVNRLSDHTGYA
jgi:hypothetical protein